MMTLKGPRSAAVAYGVGPCIRSPSVSVIIPTRNEARWLPVLLRCLCRQSTRPAEIIVADAGSSDGTRTLCDRAGVCVVRGGRPAAARNAGARRARGDYLLFLDADTAPSAGFIGRLLFLATTRHADILSCRFCPVEAGRTISALFCFVSAVFSLENRLGRPRGLGGCLLVNREVHHCIGGFDEELGWGEDLDYLERAVARGFSYVYADEIIPVSARRFIRGGVWQTCVTYLLLDLARRRTACLRRSDFGYFSADDTARC